MARFDKKVALVTGAGSGIGAATARRLAAEGAAVVVSDINSANAEAVAAELVALRARAIAVRTDVADEASVAATVDKAVVAFGGLDIMVNNAGIGAVEGDIDQGDTANWNKVIGVNLTGVYFGVKHAARAMKAGGHGGAIVNVASILGHVGFAHSPAYVAAKHGVLGLTKAAALELAPLGIRVTAVAPAFIKTPLISGLEDAVLPLHPVKRLGTSEEVAALICFLASDEGAFITGSSHLVDGGYVAQ